MLQDGSIEMMCCISRENFVRVGPHMYSAFCGVYIADTDIYPHPSAKKSSFLLCTILM